MKEYIERISRGNIQYNRPVMNLSETVIEGSYPFDEVIEAEFVLSSDETLRGVVYSTNELVKLKADGFTGKSNNIRYSINTKGLEKGNVIKGEFNIVSNAGEKCIPYSFEIIKPYVKTSLGRICTLQEFVSLYREYPQEAVKLFVNPEFRRIFIAGDIVLGNKYEVFKENKNINCAIEEFLVSAGLKNEVKIEISDSEFNFSDIKEDFTQSIEIRKSSWGYGNINISTDCDFIKITHYHINSEMFIGNTYELEILFLKEKMHAGKNFGRIYIDSFSEHFVINIQVDEPSAKNNERERKIALSRLTEEYLKFRLKKSDKDTWIDKSNYILDRARAAYNDDVYFKLIQAQVYAVQERTEDGRNLISQVRDSITEDINGNIELYCFYLYVNSMYLRSAQFTRQAVKVVREYYETGHDNWRMLWILFYLDESENRNLSIKLARIKDAFHNGCTSPVMYYEAMLIINQQPLLLRVLNDFEVQVLNFGCKYNLIEKELAHHICNIIGSTKVVSVRILGILKYLNSCFNDDYILSSLITHMIRNNLIGVSYVNLYETGILRGLKITGLYESYILSLDKSKMNALPKMVLMYFAYENQLDINARSYLYASILTNNQQDKKVMDMYSDQIEKFGMEHMIQGDISEFLLIIYRYLLNKNTEDEALQDFIKSLLFTYKIYCNDKNIDYVKVKHKELKSAVKYRMSNGIAFVQMYTDNCCISFSEDDQVYKKSGIIYEVERVFEDEEYLESLRKNETDDFYLRLHFNEKYLQSKEKNEIIYKSCVPFMESSRVNNDFVRHFNTWMINYFYSGYEGNEFEQRYQLLDKNNLKKSDASKLIETCIANEMYTTAFNLVGEYGYEQIQISSLLKLIRNMISIYNSSNNSLLIRMCGYIFKLDKYDGTILEYMSDYFNDTNAVMFELWKACVNYEIQADELTARLIAQMLFTAQYGRNINELFKSYYSKGHDDTIVTAYTVMSSYLYFAKDYEFGDYAFEAIEKYVFNDRCALEICRLALLKHYSEKPEKILDDKRIAMAQSILDDLCSENKIFAFFQKFNGVLSIPYNAIDKTVVEYKADDESKVVIYYKTEDSDTYKSENMKCNAGGIYTKCFTCFYSEVVTYYIVAEKGGESIKTRETTITFDKDMFNNTEGRFAGINKMLKSKDEHDMATVRKLMYGYAVDNYVVSEMFKTMD